MCVDRAESSVRYEVFEEKDGSLLFSTDSLRVRIDQPTGKVTISDVRGKIILGEANRDRPPFGPDTAEGEHAYTVSATFGSPTGESLYGLGQQQNGWLDYKDRSLTLLQQNSSVAIPFSCFQP